VTFEASATLLRIEQSAFHSCSSLSSICIPSSVEMICGWCFCNCTALSSVTFQAGSRLLRLGHHAFHDCSSLSAICIPATLLEVGDGGLDCVNLKDISIEDGSLRFKILDDFLVDFDCTWIIKYFGFADCIMIPG
jgi:hypothetical protein